MVASIRASFCRLFIASNMMLGACGDDSAEPDAGRHPEPDAGNHAEPDAGDAQVLDDAGTMDSGHVADASVGSCVEHSITWSSEGGLASHRAFYVEPCRTFRVENEPFGDPASEICNNEIPLDGDVTPADINALVADPDVQAALAAAPITYGADATFIDVPLTSIEIDGVKLYVGQPCGDAGTCIEIPAGVAALIDAAQELLGQAHDVTPTCLNTI